MITVAFFTTTRADFGVLPPLIREIDKSHDMNYSLFTGGSHVSREYGYTIQEINGNRFSITKIFNYLGDDDTSYGIAKGLSKAVSQVAEIFKNCEFDYICLVGDRCELLSIVSNAILFKKPIIHIHGGEQSEGAIDEQVRHMITKAAHLHFVSCEQYGENLRRMGEPAWRIFNTGALGVDNIVKNPKIPKLDLFTQLNLERDRPLALMTYHPVTLEFSLPAENQVNNVFDALDAFNHQVLVTAPNAEVGRAAIVAIIKERVARNPNYHYVESLGANRYHSLIPHCEFVIGNSSSGIIEVPFLKVPTVNIGDRQKGRIRHVSVIDTGYDVDSIRKGIRKAISEDFRNGLARMTYKFGDGHAAEKMIEIIRQTKIDQTFMRKRLEFPIES